MIPLTGIWWVLFLSIVYMLWNCGLCSKNQLLSDKIGVWWEASRCFSIHSDATCNSLLPKNGAWDGKMRVLRCLKARSFLRLSSGFGSPDGLTIRRAETKAPSQENVGLLCAFDYLNFFRSFAMLCHAMAMLCCKEWQIGSHVIFVVYWLYVVCVVWVCILKRTLIPTAKYLCLLNMTDCQSMH